MNFNKTFENLKTRCIIGDKSYLCAYFMFLFVVPLIAHALGFLKDSLMLPVVQKNELL